MAALKEHVKLFIVTRLACFNTPTEVAEAVKEEFSLVIDRSHVGAYDPTIHKGRELGQKYRKVFEETRAAFLAETMERPIASRAYRLDRLQNSYNYFVSKKNYIAANQVLEQAAKEVGNYYTNKIKVGGDTENPLMLFAQQIAGGSMPIVHDVDDVVTIEQPKEVKPAKVGVKKPDWTPT